MVCIKNKKADPKNFNLIIMGSVETGSKYVQRHVRLRPAGMYTYLGIHLIIRTIFRCQFGMVRLGLALSFISARY